MRHIVLPLTILAMTTSSLAYAQGQPAGAVPTLSQAPAGIIPQQDESPARAPGSKADDGTALPKASDNSGTTTTYATAPPETEVQWPCAQRKVATISAGTMWSGPSIDEGKDWDQDNSVAELAQKLAARRTSLDDATTMIKEFASKAGPDKDKQLTMLFVGVLDIINGNRDEILQGITRYAQGQERLAQRISEEADKISDAQGEALGPTGIAVDERNRDFQWDQRIFKDRRQALSYVCDTPSILEHRAFEISKRIQAQL